MYNPHFQRTKFKQASLGDKLSDKFLGTNKVAEINAYNQESANQTAAWNNYDMQKAVNINKYSWNQQGMLSAGINPLIGSGNLGSVSGGPQMGATDAPDQGTTGLLGEVLDFVKDETKDLLHELSPASQVRFAREKALKSTKTESSSTYNNTSHVYHHYDNKK